MRVSDLPDSLRIAGLGFEGAVDTEDPNAYPSVTFGDVQALGDWDGDGRDDFVLMAPSHGAKGERSDLIGRAYLITEEISGETTVDVGSGGGDFFFTEIQGAGKYDELGDPVGLAADINGDGRKDILLSSTNANLVSDSNEQLQRDVGTSFIFTDLVAGLTNVNDADVLFRGVYEGAPLVWSSGLGDINGDGYEDVGIYMDNGVGDMLIFFSAREGGELFSIDADIRLFGDAGEISTSAFGASTAAGFDANQDGFDDVVIAAPREGYGGLGEIPESAGAAYLFLGPLSGISGPDHAAMRWMGDQPDGRLGLPQVIDADQDGALDLLLSAPGAMQSGGARGAVYMFTDAFGGI
jgi:hypothetical protein